MMSARGTQKVPDSGSLDGNGAFPRVGSGGLRPHRLGPRDAGLLILVATVWGFNFIPIDIALIEIPPFALVSVRFLLAAVPMVFLVRRPNLPTSIIAAYGLAIGCFEFGLLFAAIKLGLAAGLASLLMQLQMFFTMGLAAVLTGDRPGWNQVGGGAVSLAGLGVLAWALLQGGAGVTALSLLLVLAASFAWAIGNIIVKVVARTTQFDMFALTVWSSLVAPIPMALASFWFEGGWKPLHAILSASLLTWACVLFMSYAATLFGYSTWNKMLRRHPAAVVMPFNMLVPVAGLTGGILVLRETLSLTQAFGIAILFAGIALAVLPSAPHDPARRMRLRWRPSKGNGNSGIYTGVGAGPRVFDRSRV
jgi:O-acetylserine/cysteine efflux transporter